MREWDFLMNIDSALVGLKLCAVASSEYQGTLESLRCYEV